MIRFKATPDHRALMLYRTMFAKIAWANGDPNYHTKERVFACLLHDTSYSLAELEHTWQELIDDGYIKEVPEEGGGD